MANNIERMDETLMDSHVTCNNSSNLQLCHECFTQNRPLCPIQDQDQNSVTFLFQPFKFLLNDLIEQNKQWKQDINQLRQQNETQQQSFVQQSTKIDELRQLYVAQQQLFLQQLTQQSTKIDELKQKCETQQQSFVEQLAQQSAKIDQLKQQNETQQQAFVQQSIKMDQLTQQNETEKQTFAKQLTQLSTIIEQLQNEIDQFKITSSQRTNDINKTQTDYQNQNSQLSDINQRHDLLKTKIESIEKYINYPRKSREYTIILREMNILHSTFHFKLYSKLEVFELNISYSQKFLA
jgi:chromosome segregation ATPase